MLLAHGVSQVCLSYSAVTFTAHVVCIHLQPWLSTIIVCSYQVAVFQVFVRSLFFLSPSFWCFFLQFSLVLCEGTYEKTCTLGRSHACDVLKRTGIFKLIL